jgi:hypothetical protein
MAGITVRKVVWSLVGLLVIAVGAFLWERRDGGSSEMQARTDCLPFAGPRIVYGENMEDSVRTRVHEEVHAAQCQRLGFAAYMLQTFRPEQGLAMEIEAFCAEWPYSREYSTNTPEHFRESIVAELMNGDGYKHIRKLGEPRIRAEIHRLCPVE